MLDAIMDCAPVIYIVDDDPAVRAGISLLVKACGWQPRPFASAEAFLQEFPRGTGACLILDMQMMGMTGADLAETLRALDVALPIIVVTAYKDHPLTERAKAAGAMAVLSKPFRDQDLIDKIQQALAC